MRTTHVVVLPYDPKWNEDFSAIRAELETAMGELALRIEHVGSTSVEGMSACRSGCASGLQVQGCGSSR